MEHASPDARYDPLRHLETVFNTCHSCNARGANKGSRSAPQNRWLFTSGWCNANRSGWGPDIHRCRPTTHETRSMKHTTFPVARDDKRGTAIDKKKNESKLSQTKKLTTAARVEGTSWNTDAYDSRNRRKSATATATYAR